MPSSLDAFLYVLGAGGSVFMSRTSWAAVAGRLSPFSPFGPLDPHTYVAGPLTADAAGNVYYNALKLRPRLGGALRRRPGAPRW